MTRTRLLGAGRGGDAWEARLKDLRDGREFTLGARAVVNAAGPWAQAVAEGTLGVETGKRLRLVKGSHIVVPRLYDGDHAYILQNTDRRIVFVLPFEGRFSLIGTTELPFDGDASGAEADGAEVDYLLAAVNGYFARPVSAADVAWSFAGVRPLFDDDAGDPSAVTRDYVLEADMPPGEPPAVSVFGGKLTTYRRLAERVVDRLRPCFPAMGNPWTADAPLPGAGPGIEDGAGLAAALARSYPDLDPDYLETLARRHGGSARRVLGDARRRDDLGADFGAGLFQREIDYLIANEWAETAADVLWRRTKAGLVMDEVERAAVERYMTAREVPAHAAP